MASGTGTDDAGLRSGVREKVWRILDTTAGVIGGLLVLVLAMVLFAFVYDKVGKTNKHLFLLPTDGAYQELRELKSVQVPQPEQAALPPSRPERLMIRSIRVDVPVKEVGADSRGLIEAPAIGAEPAAGWYKGGPSPGAAGVSLITGRVKGPKGPALFYMISALRPGHTIEVEREDGMVAVFSVYRTEVQERDIPSRYHGSASPKPELHLTTYKAEYNDGAGTYRASTTVFARLLSVARRHGAG
ncbi:class F sortase [Streptomyces sp. NPDC001774]